MFLDEETRDLYYNKIAGADRETERNNFFRMASAPKIFDRFVKFINFIQSDLKMEFENMEKDSARLNEFCAKLDGETKFSYQTFSCNRNDLEKSVETN